MAVKINGETFQFKGSASRADSETIIEIDNSEDSENTDAQIRLTDRGETDPSGRFRLRVSGGSLLVEAATLADWADSRTLLSFDSNGIKDIAFSDDGLVELLKALLLHLEAGGGAGLLLRQLLETAALNVT